MGILLAFAPFIAFAVVDRLGGATEGLVVGALVAAGLLVRDWMSRDREPKVLEVGTVLLFGGLALVALVGDPGGGDPGGGDPGGGDPGGSMFGSVFGVRLLVDAGLLVIVLVSIAIRKPFTLQYAREQVAPDLWNRPEFVRTNYVITGVWALAFAVMVVADYVLLAMPDLPPRVGIIATVLALVGAIKFTDWYPRRRQAAP